MTPPINESPVGTARLARNSFAVRLGSNDYCPNSGVICLHHGPPANELQANQTPSLQDSEAP
jgi:hypothetical protein